MQRHFNCFQEVAPEASTSRAYGGIHYRNSVDAEAEQGKKVSRFIIEKVLAPLKEKKQYFIVHSYLNRALQI
ncbi:MAG: hypothetical protein ABI707_13965 [Ferruginibacter sp.]